MLAIWVSFVSVPATRYWPSRGAIARVTADSATVRKPEARLSVEAGDCAGWVWGRTPPACGRERRKHRDVQVAPRSKRKKTARLPSAWFCCVLLSHCVAITLALPHGKLRQCNGRGVRRQDGRERARARERERERERESRTRGGGGGHGNPAYPVCVSTDGQLFSLHGAVPFHGLRSLSMPFLGGGEITAP